MQLPTLYKLTEVGNIQQWRVVVKNNSYFSEEGVVEGQITVNKPTFCEGKNLGKSNETSPQDQALKEAQAKHKKKLEKGYCLTIEEAKKGKSSFYEPMLAHNFDDYKSEIKYPVYSQPKLDGCLSYDTVVSTENGPLELGVLVDNKLKCKVLSYNTKTKKQEYKEILNYAKNGIDIKESCAQWYQIETSNGGNLKVTGNHLIYLPRLKCWRRADELSEGDVLLLEN